MVSGFERLQAPDLLVLIVSFMYRYSFVFIEEAAAHAAGRWSPGTTAPAGFGTCRALGHMLSALFLRSYGRGERVYVAMLSRGYEGTFTRCRHGPSAPSRPPSRPMLAA